MYTYHCHNKKTCTRTTRNAKHVETANNKAYFQDTCLQTCQPAKQQRCGNLKFRSCYVVSLRRLDDREDSVFIFEQWNSILVGDLCFSLHFNTFQTILVVKMMNFGYNRLKNTGLKDMTFWERSWMQTFARGPGSYDVNVYFLSFLKFDLMVSKWHFKVCFMHWICLTFNV